MFISRQQHFLHISGNYFFIANFNNIVFWCNILFYTYFWYTSSEEYYFTTPKVMKKAQLYAPIIDLSKSNEIDDWFYTLMNYILTSFMIFCVSLKSGWVKFIFKDSSNIFIAFIILRIDGSPNDKIIFYTS